MVGNTSTGSSRFAMKDGDATVYTVAGFLADWATADEKKFQKPVPGDAGAGKDGASASMPKPMPVPGMPAMPPGHP
jgi:hypothetical protein